MFKKIASLMASTAVKLDSVEETWERGKSASKVAAAAKAVDMLTNEEFEAFINVLGTLQADKPVSATQTKNQIVLARIKKAS